MYRDYQFDNRVELKTQFPNKFVGVTISAQFFHHGMKQDCVETSTYYPELNESCYGNAGLPVAAVEAYKVEATNRVISKIDEHIAQLQSIKQQLQDSIK